MKTPPSPEFMSLASLAKYADMSVKSLRRAVHDPVTPLPAFSPGGGRLLVRIADFDQWLAARRRRPALAEVIDSVLKGMR